MQGREGGKWKKLALLAFFCGPGNPALPPSHVPDYDRLVVCAAVDDGLHGAEDAHVLAHHVQGLVAALPDDGGDDGGNKTFRVVFFRNRLSLTILSESFKQLKFSGII